MTLDERARSIRAVRDCLRYMQADINKANLPVVALHINIAIAEAETILDELAPRFSEMDASDSSQERAAGTSC